jgi:hypothetical protein
MTAEQAQFEKMAAALGTTAAALAAEIRARPFPAGRRFYESTPSGANALRFRFDERSTSAHQARSRGLRWLNLPSTRPPATSG